MSTTIRIEHSRAEGTVVEGTARGDGSALPLKSHRFRWSRSMTCWYQPHSRDRAADRYTIDRLATALRGAGFTVEITIEDARTRPFAEAEAERTGRAAARADRYDDRAERAVASRDAHHQAADDALAGIPPGQPILVDHHSARRHQAALARHDRHMRAAINDGERAAHWQRRTEAADHYQQHRENVGTTRRRIDRLQAQRRRIQRLLAGTQHPEVTGRIGEDGKPELRLAPAQGDYRTRLAADAAQLDDELAYWQDILAQAQAGGAKLWGPEDFQVGDYADCSGTLHKVLKVNKKSLTVPSLLGDWTGLLPYTKISGRRRPGTDATPSSSPRIPGPSSPRRNTP
ncbi:DUF3560 domain-containing protein [Frankia sp. B2]|uniref:DUF3560 domain-containing protein n=1 Tax=Frankia sp. B2 TaxID=2541730 RepID=UPI00106A4A40|nr:DUF3560 domain-containing protein [Frankia sp. B2]TFE31023.1 DUF3560 domain-containing protein [Frankia sp. B2]